LSKSGHRIECRLTAKRAQVRRVNELLDFWQIVVVVTISSNPKCQAVSGPEQSFLFFFLVFVYSFSSARKIWSKYLFSGSVENLSNVINGSK